MIDEPYEEVVVMEGENGHNWECRYKDKILTSIKCTRCNNDPIDVMGQDFKVLPCIGVQ